MAAVCLVFLKLLFVLFRSGGLGLLKAGLPDTLPALTHILEEMVDIIFDEVLQFLACLELLALVLHAVVLD